MNEEEIKKILTSCIESEMDLIQPGEMEGYNHEFSSRYNKKIEKLLRQENLKKRLHLRRVAAAVIVIVSLISVTDISARMFGIRPWNYITSFDDVNIMDKKEYLGPNKNISMEDEALLKITKEMPEYIPDGFVKEERIEDLYSFMVQWKKSDSEEISYHRLDVLKSMSTWVNSECDSRERISIAGYEGNYYVKDEESWIQWDDTDYCHLMLTYNVENAKSELIRMAESLY